MKFQIELKVLTGFVLTLGFVSLMFTACGSNPASPSSSPTPVPNTPTPTLTPNASAPATFQGYIGGNPGPFTNPYGVAGNSAGTTLYVADQAGNAVYEYTNGGTSIASWGGSGTGAGTFNGPGGVAVDSSGNVYVVDTGNHLVQKFSAAGSYLTQWAGHGTAFSSPYGIAVNSAGTTVYVADQGNSRIQAFGPTGTYQTQWTVTDPWGVAVDSSGDVYVTEETDYTVAKFDDAGNSITTWGASGTGNGTFGSPIKGITVDPRGNIDVADCGNNLIQRFTNTGTFLVEWTAPAGNPFNHFIEFLWADPSGNVYATDNELYQFLW